MADRLFEAKDLWRILRDGAGAENAVDLDRDGLEATFEDLGYDSIALLETASRISREYGVVIDDDALSEAKTPRSLIDLINEG
jgi:minimal PKS acyl carrier protein